MASLDAHFYEPKDGHRLAFDPFNSIVGPRPIGWISTHDRTGSRNLAPYSFFNAFNYHPPIIGFSSIGWKDTVANVQETGEFVWNLATKKLSEAVNLSSAMVGKDVDEFDLANLTPAAGRVVAAPRVVESPVNFECKLTEILRLKGIDQKAVDTWLVLGEVVAVHIDQAALLGGVFDTFGQHPILRAGRLGDYAEITAEARFELTRPA